MGMSLARCSELYMDRGGVGAAPMVKLNGVDGAPLPAVGIWVSSSNESVVKEAS